MMKKGEKVMTQSDFDKWLEEVCTPENIHIEITVDPSLSQTLNNWEKGRLIARLPMLEQLSKRLVANMIKGIRKYGEQQQSKGLKYWLDHGIDDAADSLNYFFLTKAFAIREGLIEQEEGFEY